MINLYRGELHKVSGIVREWPLPKPTITMSAFRQALEKRNAAWQGRPVSHSTSSSCLVRQDTGASGSQDASPLRHHHRSSAGAEQSERDEAGEGRGESDGNGKGKEPEYMEEDDVADETEEGGGSRLGRRGSSGSNVDGSVPMEESFALISVKGNPAPADHECKPEGVEQGDNNNSERTNERKKRKREEAAAASTLLEAKKGKSKVKKEVVEPMAVDAAAGGGGEENEMYAERVGLGSGIDEVREVGRGVVNDEEKEEEEEEEGVLSIGGLGLVKQERESSKSEERDPVKVEAPSTPPVHTEEQNLGNASEVLGNNKLLPAHGLFLSCGQLSDKNNNSGRIRTQIASEAPSTPPVHTEEQNLGNAFLQEKSGADTKTTTNSLPIKKACKAKLEEKLKILTAEKHRLVQMLKQVLSTEESKKKVQSTSQSPPAPILPTTSQPPLSTADVPATPAVQPDTAAVSTAEVQASADLEEGELEYARTPSPPSHSLSTSHSTVHGGHTSSHGPSASLGPLLGRQPQHMSQGGASRTGYYPQGLGLPTPSPAAPGGAMSPGPGFLPLSLAGRPYQHMALHHVATAAAIHAQKLAVQSAANHSHMNPILGGGGPAGTVNGVTNGPPGFVGYGVSPSVHGHHGHIPQGASPGAGHMAAQQGVVSPSLLTTPRGGAGYHDMRLGNPPWNLQR